MVGSGRRPATPGWWALWLLAGGLTACSGEGTSSLPADLDPDPEPVLDQWFTPDEFSLFASSPEGLAQTFSVGTAGYLTRIDVFVNEASGVVEFDLRPTVNGLPSTFAGDALFHAVLSGVADGAFHTIMLGPDGILVRAGERLAVTMWSSDNLGWAGRSDNGYAGGIMYWLRPGPDWASVSDGADVGFRVWVRPLR